ncbi:MAG: LTA synthase family protein [Eubacteriales bacterium]|nr:LTA synthase family protein [Eubacteriales bacterium]
MSDNSTTNKKNIIKGLAQRIKGFFLVRKSLRNAKPFENRLCDKGEICGRFSYSVPNLLRLERILFWLLAALPLIMADLSTNIINPLEHTPINMKYISYYTIIPTLFTLFWITTMIYLCWAILPKVAGRITYAILTAIWGAWLFANYISYCIFGRFLLFKSIFLAGEGMDYLEVIPLYLNPTVIMFIITYCLAMYLACRMWERPTFARKHQRGLLILIPITGLICVELFMRVSLAMDKSQGQWKLWDRPTLIYDVFTDSNKSIDVAGFYQYTFKSMYRMAASANEFSEEDLALVKDYFDNKQFPDNDMTGRFEGKNVILVLMESMDDWIIDRKYTPTIKYMMDTGINFTNHYMPCWGTGYTFNSEFAVNTGFNCPSTEVSASAYPNNAFPSSLARAMIKGGYSTKSFHFNSPTFYNRGVIHPKTFGYEEYVSYLDYMSEDTYSQDSLNVQNDEIFGELIRNGEMPFMNYMMTYSAHLPYYYREEDPRLNGILDRNPDLFDNTLSEEEANARVMAHDTDEFFRILIERLDEAGQLDNTVIIGFSDHYSYGLTDQELVKQLNDNIGNKMMEQVPFFIWTPNCPRIQVKKPTSALNIMPTIKNLMGVPNYKYCMGEDAFSPDYTGFVYFPEGKWVTDKMIYAPNDGKTYTDEEQTYIDSINERIYYEMKVNDIVIKSDYFNNHHNKKK